MVQDSEDLKRVQFPVFPLRKFQDRGMRKEIMECQPGVLIQIYVRVAACLCYSSGLKGNFSRCWTSLTFFWWYKRVTPNPSCVFSNWLHPSHSSFCFSGVRTLTLHSVEMSLEKGWCLSQHRAGLGIPPWPIMVPPAAFSDYHVCPAFTAYNNTPELIPAP